MFLLNNTLLFPTYINEPLSYLHYPRAGIEAPRAAHAVVQFNGETKGIYVVVEAVNNDFLKERFGSDAGNLYEGPWDFNQDIGVIELKDEDQGRTRDDLISLADVVNNAADGAFPAALAAHMDVDEMLTTVAVDMSFCLWDSYTVAAWNFYLYDDPARGFLMLPHGADWPYLVSDLDPMNPDFRPWGADFPAGSLAMRLVTTMPDQYAAALHHVRDDAFDLDVMNARIDEVDALVHTADTSDAVVADAVAAFDDNVDDARAFVSERRAFLDGF
jgi:spore coat protein CotH